MKVISKGLVCSAAALVVSVVLIILFPRYTHAVAGTIFAVLFWLSLVACVLEAIQTVKRYKRKKSAPTNRRVYKSKSRKPQKHSARRETTEKIGKQP